MRKNYNTPEIEIVESLDVVSTSRTVESEKIPLVNGVTASSLDELYEQ